MNIKNSYLSHLIKITTKIPHFSHQSSSTTSICIGIFTIFKNQIIVNISLTFIDNITGISPTVIFGNKIQKFCLVTSDVTSDIWSVTSYVTNRSPVGVYVHARLSCLWRHHGEIIKHKVDHKRKSGNVTGRVIQKQNQRPFGGVTERDLRKQNP